MSSLASLSAALAPFEEDDITEEDTEHNDVTETRDCVLQYLVLSLSSFFTFFSFLFKIKTRRNQSLESRNLDYGERDICGYSTLCTVYTV